VHLHPAPCILHPCPLHRSWCPPPGTYLSSGWNVLDFLVVITGILEVSDLAFNDVGILRLFRLLRPLRTFSAVMPLKNMVSAVLSALGELASVGALLLFIVLLFGIVMKELFGPVLHSRCRFSNFPLQIPSVNLSEAEDMGWNASAPGNCVGEHLLLRVATELVNCSSAALDTGRLYWHRLWGAPHGTNNSTSSSSGAEYIAFFDSVDAWYYMHAALVANASTPLLLDKSGAVNQYAAHAREYVARVTGAAAAGHDAWGLAYGLPNGGRCSDATATGTRAALPVTFAQCAAVCYDIGLDSRFTCTRSDGTWCEFDSARNRSIKEYEHCRGTNCDAFQVQCQHTLPPLPSSFSFWPPTHPRLVSPCPYLVHVAASPHIIAC
jgi:hypothetical protein